MAIGKYRDMRAAPQPQPSQQAETPVTPTIPEKYRGAVAVQEKQTQTINQVLGNVSPSVVAEVCRRVALDECYQPQEKVESTVPYAYHLDRVLKGKTF